MTASVARLANGRLHLQDGPIDLIIHAEGHGTAEAERAATEAFNGLLAGLVRELPTLRRAMGKTPPTVRHPIATRMVEAVWPHRGVFVTPMAAVAGAVADHILAVMVAAAPTLTKAWVNDGGDIALHLTADAAFEIGLVPRVDAPALAGTATVRASDPVRGVATSGRGGRSLSLGIADAVTVLARTAAEADVAATLIANAVDLPSHPNVTRGPASAEDLDSDLGDRPVVLAVGALTDDEAKRALKRGAEVATRMQAAGLIQGAALSLIGHWRVAGISVSGLILG